MNSINFLKNVSRYLMPVVSQSEVSLVDVIKIKDPLVLNAGMHTIKRIASVELELFEITPSNLIKGYVHADGNESTLDLTTGKPKLVIVLKNSFYHFLLDYVANIIESIEQYPDHELIIDVSSMGDLHDLKSNSTSFFFEFLFLLNHYGVEHKVVRLVDYDVVYIDNFYKIRYDLTSSLKAEKVYEYFLPYVKDKTIKPFRSVYVSRKIADSTFARSQAIADLDFYYDGLRIDDEEALEKLFKSLGFEIIYPEKFEGFDEQINFFHSVKTIASLTSSGLTNAVFMQPGGTVIEIASPIIATPISEIGELTNLQKSIHNFYKDLSFLKKHIHISIQNPNFKFEDVKNAIESNQALKKFLKVKSEKTNNL